MAQTIDLGAALPEQVHRVTLANANALQLDIGPGIRLMCIYTEGSAINYSHAGVDGGAIDANYARIPPNTRDTHPVFSDQVGHGHLVLVYVAAATPPTSFGIVVKACEEGQ